MNEELPESEKDNVRGWIRFGEINGEIDGVNHNLNTLLGLYRKAGFKNVTKSHWRDGGPKQDIWGNGQKGGVVKSPLEGDGYVWSEEDYVFRGFLGFKEWKVKMSYPVFTSECSGITVDLRRGAFQRDGNGGGHSLRNKPVKLINFAALNDHGPDTGITGAVKNYMGIVDLSCGYWGLQPKGYVNVHFCGERFYPYAKGGPLGHFAKTIRKADLNIITAEWVGWGSRTDPQKAARKQTILASTDAIALDYYAAKYLVFPITKDKGRHDPDNRGSSIRKFLEVAADAAGEGALDENSMRVHVYDFRHSS
jgi:hypothetical protein